MRRLCLLFAAMLIVGLVTYFIEYGRLKAHPPIIVIDCTNEARQVDLRSNGKSLVTDYYTIRQSIEERMQHVTGKKK